MHFQLSAENWCNEFKSSFETKGTSVSNHATGMILHITRKGHESNDCNWFSSQDTSIQRFSSQIVDCVMFKREVIVEITITFL
jgi:intein-encoded DNA endonuclease-like protein